MFLPSEPRRMVPFGRCLDDGVISPWIGGQPFSWGGGWNSLVEKLDNEGPMDKTVKSVDELASGLIPFLPEEPVRF